MQTRHAVTDREAAAPLDLGGAAAAAAAASVKLWSTGEMFYSARADQCWRLTPFYGFNFPTPVALALFVHLGVLSPNGDVTKICHLIPTRIQALYGTDLI